ncbi:acetyltransferase [Campylobacter iguaniorum]|uniref:Acetyltransferase n=1 Tax=Campylobacter iguaniorum TaxID=1244531 RepID=A0A076F862_9BACT|nr:GNAT family N-acetyltransferase [Campylobacter iguaniorum]AII14395.1 acetyltransferase [Campylobacter iguaniorum]ALV24130.1 acetyltransferase [Campylobacter iguaniorum]
MISIATKQDAKSVIELLNLAMEDIAFSLSGTSNLEQSNQILQEFFAQKGNRLSYENILVYRLDSKVVGAICSYDGSISHKLDEPFIRRLILLGKEPKIQPECSAKELYIDSLATDPNYQKRGIATKLIEACFQKALNLGLDKVSLIVDTKKEKTKKYYESLGFAAVGKKCIANHEYTYMIKDLK